MQEGPEVPAACHGQERVELRIEPSVITYQGYPDNSKTLVHAEISNCTAARVFFVTLRIWIGEKDRVLTTKATGYDSVVYELEAPLPLDPGTRRELTFPMYLEKKYLLEAQIRDTNGHLTFLEKITVRLVDEALRKAKADCSLCHGTWGRFGENRQERCSCRTEDAGRKCYDGLECEGRCLATGSFLPMPTASCPLEQPCPPAKIRGFWLGKCAEFTSTFSCYAYLPEGWTLNGPTTRKQQPPQICMD